MQTRSEPRLAIAHARLCHHVRLYYSHVVGTFLFSYVVSILTTLRLLTREKVCTQIVIGRRARAMMTPEHDSMIIREHGVYFVMGFLNRASMHTPLFHAPHKPKARDV